MLPADFKAHFPPLILNLKVAGTVGYELWVVVDLTEVSEHDGAEAGVVKSFKEGERIFVGEMAVAAADALFELPWVGAVDEELHIVIRFEDEAVATRQTRLDELSRDSEVRTDAQAASFVLDDEPSRLSRIMRDGERVDTQISQHKRSPRLEYLAMWQGPNLCREAFQSPSTEKDREIIATAEGPAAPNMIQVLVAEDQTVELIRFDGGLIEAANELLGTQPRIHQDSGSLAANQRCVPFGATGKNLEKKCHISRTSAYPTGHPIGQPHVTGGSCNEMMLSQPRKTQETK
jgi:hypothetical protein